MKISIDTDAKTITVDGVAGPLYSKASFEILSDVWVKVGWSEKHSYTFSWAGVPIIQLPEDMIRFQELVWRLRPDVIIETGVAHGGSLIYSNSLCKLIGNGRVIGVDIRIRPQNRANIEGHPLYQGITLLEGSSTAPDVLAAVRSLIRPTESVLVVLDSNHSYEHVLAEMQAYAPLVSKGSYIVATDGVMKDLSDAPRGRPEWVHDNPAKAASDFVRENRDFVLEEPVWPFNESDLDKRITHWPGAFAKRIR